MFAFHSVQKTPSNGLRGKRLLQRDSTERECRSPVITAARTWSDVPSIEFRDGGECQTIQPWRGGSHEIGNVYHEGIGQHLTMLMIEIERD